MASPTPSSNSNPWFAVSMGLVGLIVGYGIAMGLGGGSFSLPSAAPAPAPSGGTTGAAPAVPTPPPSNDTPATAGNGPVLGDKNAKVTIIEFTDFQCPFCARHFQQTFPQIKKDYVDTGKVKYVIRYFPLSFHQFAQKAAETAACANDQGKFWEMHDKLFTNQDTWSQTADAVPTFKKYAADLKLNTATFNACLDGDKHKDEIAKDIADGSASGIDGTPGFWILGPNNKSQKISGAYPYDTFKTAFDNMLK